MSGAGKTRKSVPAGEVVSVNTGEVCVAIEGIDRTAIAGSFTVHLLKNGTRIASRFFFQPSQSAEAVQVTGEDRFAHFDFLLPLEDVAEGQFSVEIEPSEQGGPEQPTLPGGAGHPTLSVYLMLEPGRSTKET